MLQLFIGSDNEAQISIEPRDAECRECVVRGRGIASGTKGSGFRFSFLVIENQRLGTPGTGQSRRALQQMQVLLVFHSSPKCGPLSPLALRLVEARSMQGRQFWRLEPAIVTRIEQLEPSTENAAI